MTNRLRAARVERGWSQTRLISELERHGRAQGIVVMSTASLRTAVSRWENGHVVPDQHYRRLLRDIYGQSDAELGLTSHRPDDELSETEDELRARIAGAARVDGGMVALLKAQTDMIRRLDRRLGAPVLLDQMRAHISTLRQLLSHAVLDSTRQPVAAVLADAAALAGWQALDTGSLRQAWHHYETAKNAARLSGDPALLARAKGEQAYALLDLGQPRQALQLVREARSEARGTVAPRMLSWLYAAEAETAAAAGQATMCRRALDHAAAVLPPGTAADPELPYLSLDAHHLARWRGSALARLGDAGAIEQLSGALASADPDYLRARGALHIDLAQALTAAKEVDAAAGHISQARTIAAQTGSVRQRQRLQQLAA